MEMLMLVVMHMSFADDLDRLAGGALATPA